MKLRNKLILSCAALAAVATTAVSTTFAWYTSNTDVSATGIIAKTESKGDDTLLISTTGKLGDWHSSVDLNIDQNLIPLALGKAGDGTDGAETPADDLNLYNWNANSDAVDTTAAVGEDGKFIEFTLYFKNQTATAAQSIYVNNFTLKNTTAVANYKPKDILSPAEVSGTVHNWVGFTGLTSEKASTYTFDLLRATNILIQKKKVAGYVNTDDADLATPGDSPVSYADATAGVDFDKYVVLDTEASHNYKDFNDVLDAKKADDTNKETGQYATAANAHTYYNAVKGTTIPTANPLKTSSIVQSGGTALNLGTTTAGESGNRDIFEVKFTIFLNGWDLQCFNGVQGQKFSLEMGFSTSNTGAVQFGTASAK